MDRSGPSVPDPRRVGPTRRVLLGWVAVVLLGHLWLLLGADAPLLWRRAEPAPAAPVQLRVIAPAPVSVPRKRASRPSAAQTATAPVAQVEAPNLEASQALAGSVPEPVAEQAVPASAPLASEPAPATASPDIAVAAPEAVPATAWPLIPLGALPPSTLMHYSLTGMDKGLTYHASGELRWQHHDTAYELTLTVRAFLLGSRHWRSVGRIEAAGLAPTRFSDSWRNERAAHFDREQQRVVFSSNSNPVALQAGAQDQVSLYVQLAAAMAGEPERFVPGTRLQVQTATVRDAEPWALTLEGEDTMPLNGRVVKVSKWLCQPRNRYEAKVEFWVAPEQAWLPVRIRITQASGSFIDLLWQGSEPLAPLVPRS